MVDLSEFHKYKEDGKLEAKKATGGLPNSLWETYSAFANTNGGVILLGVDELSDKSLSVVGLDNPNKMIGDFWNIANNRQKISASILMDKYVYAETIDGKSIVVIEVPRADRGLRPVFINQNPYEGTYRRDGEGDYHCTPETVRAMFRDSGDKSQDMLVLSNMSLDVFDYESLQGFRNRMRVTRPNHVWEKLEDIEFLHKMGAIGIGEDEKLHPTAAGLLMFGFEYEITREYPNYFLDYQEKYDSNTRYTDRIYSTSGEWSGNVIDFFFKAYNKLIQNPKIKVPFKTKDGLTRLDDTPVHEVLREALVNCISNADFYGERGLVIRNNIDNIIFENPGIYRMDLNEALSGGVSSPRNATILKTFNFLNIGERAGSGIPMILETWKNEGFDPPTFSENIAINRSFLTLPIIKISDIKQTTVENISHILSTGEERKRSIIEYLTYHSPASSRDIANHLGISQNRVLVYLRDLGFEGSVNTEGESRNRTYSLNTKMDFDE